MVPLFGHIGGHDGAMADRRVVITSLVGAGVGVAMLGTVALRLQPAVREVGEEEGGLLPTAWIGVADLDLLRDEAVDYAHRLQAAGVACELHVEPGG